MQHVNKASIVFNRTPWKSHCQSRVEYKQYWALQTCGCSSRYHLPGRPCRLRWYPGEQLLEQNSCVLKQTLRQGWEVGRAANKGGYNYSSSRIIIILTGAQHYKEWFQNYIPWVGSRAFHNVQGQRGWALSMNRHFTYAMYISHCCILWNKIIMCSMAFRL